MVQTGHLQDDTYFVLMAKAAALQMAELAEAAIEEGSLSIEQVFDSNYVAVTGSKPERFTSKFSDWATCFWQPHLDALCDQDPRIHATVCSDRNGFLPTHMTKMSQEPTGDIYFDTQFCRNGRIIMGPTDIVAKSSDTEYFMSVYRHEGDGLVYRVIRNVYIPMYICGKRWGDYEIAYKL
jgi:methyl-accepting chemotaxis protein